MGRAFSGGVISIFHNTEDFIRKIEEYKRMGYNHIAIGNATFPSLDQAASLTVWKDVLPHVR
jgi:hypothetical protein